MKEWERENPGREITTHEASKLLNSLPTQSALVAERVVNILAGNGALKGELTEKVKSLLENDKPLARLIDPSD
jgi:hypothetical protein